MAVFLMMMMMISFDSFCLGWFFSDTYIIIMTELLLYYQRYFSLTNFCSFIFKFVSSIMQCSLHIMTYKVTKYTIIILIQFFTIHRVFLCMTLYFISLIHYYHHFVSKTTLKDLPMLFPVCMLWFFLDVLAFWDLLTSMCG